MRRRRKALFRSRVRKLAKKHYWDGFLTRLEDGSKLRALTYTGANSDWLNLVADYAYSEGWKACDEVFKKREQGKRFIHIDREVPDEVLSEAYLRATGLREIK